MSDELSYQFTYKGKTYTNKVSAPKGLNIDNVKLLAQNMVETFEGITK